MTGAVLYGPRDVRFEERAAPTIIEPTDAIIRISATCVCGSDLWPYRQPRDERAGGNQGDGQAMSREIKRRGSQPPTEAPADHFTGRVRIEPLFSGKRPITWHGASPTTAMTHIAIQGAVDGKNVDWMEKVTGEQYNTKPGTKTNRFTETLASGLGQGVLDV